MKKMKLTRSLLAACSIVALTAVMYGCVHNGGDDEPEAPVTTDPPPDPGPTDLEDTQAAAAAAATVAMAASTSAAMSASDATAATMTLATLQTGADSNSGMMGGREHASAARYAAKDAADAATAAAAASAAAAAATTGEAGETAWRMAVAAQEEAEAAMASAATHSAAAITAAMTELHIDGSMKSAGDSSVDANMGMLTVTADDGSKTITGHVGDVARTAGMVAGQAFVRGEDPALDKAYMQAVEARSLAIGKTVDTTDDKARLTVIHSRAGSKSYRVFIDAGTLIDNAEVAADGKVTVDIDGTDTAVTLKPLGLFIEATTAATPPDGAVADGLDFSDIVHAKLGATADDRAMDTAKANKPVQVYSYPGADGPEYVVEVNRLVDAVDGTEMIDLQPVDITATAAPDSDRDTGTADAHEEVGVTAAVPTATKYEHIHFGVWAGLGAATATGAQMLSGLGVGWVQNISGSGMTDRLGIGTVMYKGDYVAVVQRQNSQGAGAFNMESGAATLTANFDKATFTGALTNLATLSGTLSGNGFSGTKATVDKDHADLNPDGSFTGEFSGGIYGAAGTEAAGVFDFDGGDDGAFRGAFGGTNQE